MKRRVVQGTRYTDIYMSKYKKNGKRECARGGRGVTNIISNPLEAPNHLQHLLFLNETFSGCEDSSQCSDHDQNQQKFHYQSILPFHQWNYLRFVHPKNPGTVIQDLQLLAQETRKQTDDKQFTYYTEMSSQDMELSVNQKSY